MHLIQQIIIVTALSGPVMSLAELFWAAVLLVHYVHSFSRLWLTQGLG